MCLVLTFNYQNLRTRFFCRVPIQSIPGFLVSRYKNHKPDLRAQPCIGNMQPCVSAMNATSRCDWILVVERAGRLNSGLVSRYVVVQPPLSRKKTVRSFTELTRLNWSVSRRLPLLRTYQLQTLDTDILNLT